MLKLILFIAYIVAAISASAKPRTSVANPYPLWTWNSQCATKGRFQDLQYHRSAIMDRIVADEKLAIPILISQMTDSRMTAKQVFCYIWPPIQVGELAHFILSDLFLNETWQEVTMPALFPIRRCDGPGWVCWGEFREKHSMKEIQARWMQFWKSSQARVYWDKKARCFRVSEKQATK